MYAIFGGNAKQDKKGQLGISIEFLRTMQRKAVEDEMGMSK